MVIHCLGFWERHNGKREAPYAAALKTKAVKKKSLFTKIWSFRLSYIFSHSWLHLSLSTQWVLFIKTLGYSLELCLRINNRSVGIPLKFPKGKLQFLNKAREASFWVKMIITQSFELLVDITHLYFSISSPYPNSC